MDACDLEQFRDFIRSSNSLRWAEKCMKLSDLDEMRKIDITMNCAEIESRIRAFHFVDYPVFLMLGDKIFNYFSETNDVSLSHIMEVKI